MAEFDGEAASLGLFHEFFSHLSTKSADDRDHHSGSGSAVSGAVDRVWKNGFGGINRVDDINKKQHSFSKSFLQPSLLHNKSDNTSAQEEHVNNNNTVDLVVEGDDDDDGSSSENMSQKSVHLEHLNKRTLAESPSSGIVVEHENVDESDDSENNEHVNAHRSLVNGTAGPVPMSYDKKKKGVTFPKDTIISGYLDPHDPWKLAPAWTTDELVSAYKKSCEVYGAKPIAKLIQQLQAFSPANSREEVLSLKGEKLDQKQCECLEEILRRVRFKLLDFEASHLDDECAVALFDMIEFYESSYQLNIAFNKNIQARGWQACSRLVRRTPELKSLDLRNCDLNERTIPIFGRALKLGCHLTILHMENMNLSGRPLIILVAALKMNDTLQELFLADNKLLPTDGIQLGNLLHYNHKLGLLDLRNNHLQDVGTRHICEGLTEQNKGSGLRTLVLWNNSINYQAMSMLGRALASSQNMETLNIGHNAITNEGVHLLKDGLLRVSSLLRLGLQGTRISDEGAVALAEYIAESLVLLRIDLRDNDIKTGGLMALAHAMRVNTSVTRIDLDKDPKKEPGIRDYVEQQSRLLKDILTFQQRNVQLALQKEEEKRSHLQEKAEAELADAKKDTHDEQQVGHLPANSSTESFTLIDEVPVEIDEDNQSAENTDAGMAEKGSNQENASPEISNHTDELDSSPHKEGGKLQQRPTVLFPWHVLSAQETLDSPLAISGFSHNKSTVSDAAVYESCSEGVVPVLPMTPAPAEIILSPQYFPKQIARKIFSVSRVSENASCQQLSSSPPLSLAFDPLCVSPLPLIPVSSTPVLLPPTVPVLQCVQRVSQHSKVSLQTDSPSASLFQHLAEETMKHLISPDTDADVSSLLQDAESDGLNTWINKTKDRDELITGLPVELDPPCAILKSSDTELADLLQAAASSEMLTEPNGDIHVCDNVESLVNDATDMLAIVSPIDSDNSDKEHLVITDASVGEHENSSLQDSAQELLTLERITENAQYPHAFTSQEFDLHQACTDESQDSVIGNHFETRIENDDSALKATTETVLRNPTNTGSHEEDFPESEQRSVHPEQLSELPCNSPFVFVDSATEMDMKINEIKDSSSSVKSNSGHQQKHVTLCVNTKSLSHSEKKQYSPILADMDAQDDLMALRLINLSNSSLHSAENIEELLFPILPDPYTSNQPVIGDSEKSLVSSLKSVQRLETGNNNNNVIPAMPPAKNMGHKLTNDPSDDQGIGDKVASDNIDIDSVDCSLDEEPWLTVGVDVEGHDSEASRTSSKQPDFFTTLSMNGLAQELASALTSFDGSSSPFEVGDYNIGS